MSEEERVIPASVRADGSVRKERRVRAGYTPPDEVQVYVPRFRRERQGGDSKGPRSLEDLVRQQASSSSSCSGHDDGIRNDRRTERRQRDRSIDMKGLEQAMLGLGLQKTRKNPVQGRGRGRSTLNSGWGPAPPPGLVKECDNGEPEVVSSRVLYDDEEGKEGKKESHSQHTEKDKPVEKASSSCGQTHQESERRREASGAEAPK